MNLNEKTRAYIYRIAGAASILAVAYGLIDSNEAALWVSAIAALVGLPLAAVNTSTKV